MPYTQKAHNFFAMCANDPGKSIKKCPPKAQAKKMMKEGIKQTHPAVGRK